MLSSVSEYLDCRLCDLSHYRGREGYNELVIYRGNEYAKICLVGEGPGENEAKTGLPFVGKAGEFLDTILLKVSTIYSDFYQSIHITNSIMCRCPNNRKPYNKEIAACSSRLVREIAETGAKFVICLGTTSLEAITLLSKITNQRGRIIQAIPENLNKNFLIRWRYYNGQDPTFNIGITLHPASIFYGSKEEQDNRKFQIEQDFIKFAHWYKSETETLNLVPSKNK